MQDNNIILRLENIGRTYPAGEEEIAVLKNINLTVKRGEMVAIIGASGSGKSTLMNILGCLDKPSTGQYYVSGRNTAQLVADELSQIRRNYFGFIFQRYHLLGALTALGNVEIPAVYSGVTPAKRAERAKKLLTRLGLEERIYHKPNQLSGGQQQRVSIARALMNDAEIILADEPTGALDKKSGEEVLRILDELHKEGRTIILVTHDTNVAARADRIIEISDGEIISDHLNQQKREETLKNSDYFPERPQSFVHKPKIELSNLELFRSYIDRLWEASSMALRSLNAHRMRTFLTMLGVIIGIAAVISMVALGRGTQEQILENISSFGTNTLTIFPGKSMSDRKAYKITTLVDADATALSKQRYVLAATPNVAFSAKIRNGAEEVNGMVSGVGAQFFATETLTPTAGRFFDEDSVRTRALDVVMEEEGAKILFKTKEEAIGKVLLIGGVLSRVIGTYKSKYGSSSDTIQLYMPYTTAQTRFLGDTKVRSISVRVQDDMDSYAAEEAITRFLTMRHGQKDFFIMNSEAFREKVMESVAVLTMLVSSIAFISLVVGGIGVMNIMLVTVSERINEIGVRMAVGARQSDILQQFLIEAILVCILGGILGIGLSMSIGWLFKAFQAPITLIYSASSIIGAVLFSSFIGICFGFLPARNASRLDPVVALARD